jgi:hypothetical protein
VETTGRRTVYLDINHWYALGEAMAGHPQKPEHVDVLHQLARLVGQGRIMIPLSAVNYVELSENPRDRQREEAAKVMTLLARSSTITSTKRIVDEELGLALNRMFGRPAFPVRVEKSGFGASFAFTGEIRQFKLTGGTADARRRLEAMLGMSVAEMEAMVNAVSEYDLLKQPPKAYWSTIIPTPPAVRPTGSWPASTSWSTRCARTRNRVTLQRSELKLMSPVALIWQFSN